MKKEILYFTNERSRLEGCLDLHKIIENVRNYYILFINTTGENVKKIIIY
jgi:hypothetical protein